MKAFIFILLLFFSMNALADENPKYANAMKKTIAKMDEAKVLQDFLDIANKFERIALAEKDKWLPFYYAALNQTLASFTDTVLSKKDSYLDKALDLLSYADSIQADESEIYVLKGMIAQGRLQIDPMNRWAKYGAESNANFQKAMELDPTNPRPEYLMGVSLYYTPVNFGGGPKAAKSVLENSLKKFDDFEKSSDLMPNWGREQVEQFLDQINNSLSENADVEAREDTTKSE